MHIRSVILFTTILAVGGGLAAWKHSDGQRAQAIAANQPEPAEVVTAAVARAAEHRRTTTSIGTVVATRSISLRNELPGTVREVHLVPGRVVESGTVLVALDVSVEEAELRALEARAALAGTTLGRLQRMAERRAISEIELDNAQAELDVALADVERTRAIIERKTIRAPFRARVGIADVHPGQFLDAGTPLTTLQGVDEAADVDFTVAQAVALGLNPGDMVDVRLEGDVSPSSAARIASELRSPEKK
jgi:membrane fusion protein, multidrug efflux system